MNCSTPDCCEYGKPRAASCGCNRPTAQRPYAYAHMCRDGHVQIGHNDSEHEACPLCRAYFLAEAMGQLCDDIIADLDGDGAKRAEWRATLRGRVMDERIKARATIASIA